MKKDVVLLVAHQFNNILIEKYFRLKKQFSKFGDVILILNKEDDEEIDIPTNMDCFLITIEMLNELEYKPIRETIIPGSNHFILLLYYLKYPNYRFYWNIEYDVEFSGNWRFLFNHFSQIEADFISSHIAHYKNNTDWMWWNSYQGVTKKIPLENRLKSFNPIYRISSEALFFLNHFLKSGNFGHHEVLIASALYHSGFDIIDFGGLGDFVIPGYENKFYISPSNKINDVFELGSMRYRPSFRNIECYYQTNKLFHPIKNDVSRLKILAIIIAYNKQATLRECLNSLLKSDVTLNIMIIKRRVDNSIYQMISKEYNDIQLLETEGYTIDSSVLKAIHKYVRKGGFNYVFFINANYYIERGTILNLLCIQNNHPIYDILYPICYLQDKKMLECGYLNWLCNECSEYIIGLILKKTIKEVYTVNFLNIRACLLTIDCLKVLSERDFSFIDLDEDTNFQNILLCSELKAGIVPSITITDLGDIG